MNLQTTAVVVGLVLAFFVIYPLARRTRRRNDPRAAGMTVRQLLTRPVVLVILAAIVVLFVVSTIFS